MDRRASSRGMGINCPDTQKFGGRGMCANTQLERMITRSVETRGCGATTRGQMSCEARACRRWRHLIAVCTSTDLVEASTEPAINSLDAQKCGGRGMGENALLERHRCELSGPAGVWFNGHLTVMAYVT